MRIAMVGGHGKIALLAAPLLIAQGHEVSALIRNPDHWDDVAATGAMPVLADVELLDAEAMVGRLAGHDAVLWTAGAGGGDPARTRAVDRDAAIASMDAAEVAGVPRYVMVSYFGAGPDHGVPAESSFHPYAEAKAAADEHLRRTDLDWTILGPSGLTDEPGSGMIETGEGVAGATVSRADVATVIAAVLACPEMARATLAFNSGSTPIDEAIRLHVGSEG